jgi:uncharacterized RDD family membrane protein YckC
MATLSQVEPAQEYAAPLPYSGLSLRVVAAILDLIFLLSVAALFASAAGLHYLLRTEWGDVDPTDEVQITTFVIMGSFLVFLPLYFILFWYWRGQTFGMMATRIAVTDRDGYHISLFQAVLRLIMWPLSVLPLGLGVTTMFFDREFRMLHDMLSGTVVVELP